MRVEVDNFPAKKKYYSMNLPVKDLDQFQDDIARCGLTLTRLAEVGENANN